MKGRADSPSIPRSLGDHEDRISKLEFAITAADLSNAIRYDIENVGDYLHVSVDTETVFALTDGANFFIDRPGSTSLHLLQVDDSTGSVYWYQAGGDWQQFTEGGDVFLSTGNDPDTPGGDLTHLTNGGDYRIDTTFIGSDDPSTDGLFRVDAGDVIVNASEDMLFKTTGGAVGITSDVGAITAHAATFMELKVGAGQTFTVVDSTGTPKLQWTEGTLDWHIPAGGILVADL